MEFHLEIVSLEHDSLRMLDQWTLTEWNQSERLDLQSNLRILELNKQFSQTES